MDKEILRILKNNDMLSLYPHTQKELEVLKKLIKANCVKEYVINRQSYIKKNKLSKYIFWCNPMEAFSWVNTNEGVIFWSYTHGRFFYYN